MEYKEIIYDPSGMKDWKVLDEEKEKVRVINSKF